MAAGIKLLEREKVVVTSKTYANTQKEARESVMRILHDLDTPYLDFCLLHGVEDGQLAAKMPALAELRRMKDQGLIRQIGLSTHCPQVAWDASDVEGIEVLCVTFNRDGSRIMNGNLDGMVRALHKAHNLRGKGTYVIKHWAGAILCMISVRRWNGFWITTIVSMFTILDMQICVNSGRICIS